MKRHIWYHIVLTIFAAWCGTGCSEGYEYFNPNPGDEEQQASPIVNTGKASVDAAAGKATLNGNCNAMGRTVSEAGFLYGRTAAEMMKSERRVCPVDEEGRFSLTLSDVDNGDHYFRAYMVIDGKTYNGVTGWFEVKVASVPEVTTELSEAAGGVLTLKGSYKLDRDLSVEPGFRYAATADGVASVQFVRATQVDEANKTFSLDIPDTGQPCFFQAVVRMSTDFYDGEVSEVIRPKDLSAAGVANCYIVTEGGWYSIEPKRPDGTAVQGSAADWVWSSGSGLVSGVHFSAGRIVFQTSGNAGNAGIALTNDAGEIVWSWHIWMAQAPAEQTVNGRTFLDRNVGATEFDGALVGSLGVYFQWGRKDPFPHPASFTNNARPASFIYHDNYAYGTIRPEDHDAREVMSVKWATQHPTTFIRKADYEVDEPEEDVLDWLFRSHHNLWGNTTEQGYDVSKVCRKTIYDPCPPGWRVPDACDFEGIAMSQTQLPYCVNIVYSGTKTARYPAGGTFDGDSYSGAGTYGQVYTNTPYFWNFDYGASYFDGVSCTSIYLAGTRRTTSELRCQANPVRCIKE